MLPIEDRLRWVFHPNGTKLLVHEGTEANSYLENGEWFPTEWHANNHSLKIKKKLSPKILPIENINKIKIKDFENDNLEKTKTSK